MLPFCCLENEGLLGLRLGGDIPGGDCQRHVSQDGGEEELCKGGLKQEGERETPSSFELHNGNRMK